MQNDHYVVNRSWAEVDLDAIRHNLQQVRQLTWKKTQVMAVVKADAYGHGVGPVAQALIDGGVDRLAVSLLDEGIELREMGVRIPIVILNYSDPRRAYEVIRYGLTQSVYSMDLVEALDKAAAYLGQVAPVHVKIDTGMGRTGLPCTPESVQTVLEIHSMSHVRVEGLYTHFATADEVDSQYVRLQFSRFLEFNQALEKRGLLVPLKHCCNSAATLRYPEMHMDLVRPGLVLYGVMPEECERFASDFVPAMSLKSSVILEKTIQAGESVSYGRTFVAESETHIATIPIGYADGYQRQLSSKAEALVHGQRCPVRGRICMDSCMLETSHLAEVARIGDEVVLFGHQCSEKGGLQSITVDEVAAWADTIPYEVLCSVGKRVPRAYLEKGKIIEVATPLV